MSFVQWTRFKQWQQMTWTSEVIIAEDHLSAEYELKVVAVGTEGKAAG